MAGSWCSSIFVFAKTFKGEEVIWGHSDAEKMFSYVVNHKEMKQLVGGGVLVRVHQNLLPFLHIKRSITKRMGWKHI